MENALQKKIKTYLEINHVSIASLERQAGLKANVVRNILRGLSKRPTGETLRAIGSVMGCTVEDLMGSKMEIPKREGTSFSEAGILLEKPELLEKSLHSVLKIMKEQQYSLTLQQTLFVLGEVYTYTLKKEPPKIDEDFIEWFIKRTID